MQQSVQKVLLRVREGRVYQFLTARFTVDLSETVSVREIKVINIKCSKFYALSF